ncbi:MAG: RagB/SusD family nutrient uptake outer membrane protein [Cyclobacteriaceae bacterium]|nr:RagB/SusD family nutrient uptake outer membrane protein [Cyclobacteriaceae bacterium]
MKKIWRLLSVLAIVMFVTACTDLDEELKGDFNANFPTTQFGTVNTNKPTPNDGLGAAFNRVLNGTANHGGYFSVQEVSSDEAVITQKGGDWFDGGIWLRMHRHEFDPQVGGINGAWNDSYGGITQCNVLLASTDPLVSTPAAKAQLRFLRAFFYWRLLDTFGRVKITTQPLVDVPQSSRIDVYNFVRTELLAAIPDLPSGKQEYGRANKFAAYALLSRLYLNAKVYKGLANHDVADLDAAIAAADEVINSGLYSLDPEYKDVFDPDNVEAAEHIFVAPFDEVTGGGMNFAMMTLHYPSQLTYDLREQPWNGYSTLEEFYNSYDATDKRRAQNFIVGPQFDLNGLPILDLAFDPDDEDGAPINYTPRINQLAPSGSRQAGARLGKFNFKRGQLNDADNDFPLLRLGEVLLNKAEAEFRKNGGGLTTINLLRARAGVANLPSLDEGVILAERGRELFQEALRRTDLIRFGAWSNAWWEKPNTSGKPHQILMPIPIEQINATAGTPNPLTQNPGY